MSKEKKECEITCAGNMNAAMTQGCMFVASEKGTCSICKKKNMYLGINGEDEQVCISCCKGISSVLYKVLDVSMKRAEERNKNQGKNLCARRKIFASPPAKPSSNTFHTSTARSSVAARVFGNTACAALSDILRSARVR